MPQEYIDFILIKELYHCTPSELDEQDQNIVDLHLSFLGIQADESYKESKRAEQRSKPW